MGTIWVKEFTGGLDTRRLPETTQTAVLIKANNGHITRGGEFESRKAFVPEFTLPEGTTGLAVERQGLVVFGSEVSINTPPGIRYQQLVHPDGETALSRVLSSDLFQSQLYAVAEFIDGSRYHYFDGELVTGWFDGHARASFTVKGGIPAVLDGQGEVLFEASEISALKVNGVEIITEPIKWEESNTYTAELIAQAVNDFDSSPGYKATAAGPTVSIIAVDKGTDANGQTVTYELDNGFSVSPAQGTELDGGAGSDDTSHPGGFVKTIGSKMYSLSGPNVHFSGVADATSWDTETVGAGFIDISAENSASDELTALDRYQNNVAVFAEGATQIWYVDPDPELNRWVQTLNNTGTSYPNSVTQFGDSDLFYLDESGLRSLRARDSSGAASTNDIGVPVDNLITERLALLTETERSRIGTIIEPDSGRFWLAMKDQIFIFSYFAGAKVSAWSTYDSVDKYGLNFDIDDLLVFGKRVYLRGGNTIYVYGGISTGREYDETVAEAHLPFLDANQPTKRKEFTALDAAAQGTWEVAISANLDDESVEDPVCTLTSTTYPHDSVPASGEATHLSPRFRSKGVGPHILSSVVVHYKGSTDDD